MTYKDIDIKSCYESGTCDIVEEFYEPVLMSSVAYDRIAGFFSSSALAIASRGLYGFIQNKGKMRLITSPILSGDDAEIIQKVTESPDALTEVDLGLNLTDICNEFVDNHVKALGWMLSNGLLEMKLAIVVKADGAICTEDEVKNCGLFHQKVGILRDVDGNELSFSGSINETASAWVNNDEEFKVFKAWEGSREYYAKDQERFSEIWEGKRHNVRVFNLPAAIKDHLISRSKDFDIETISIKRYRKSKVNAFDFKNSPISLFYYQADALNKWKENVYSLLFEMATGTGKTRTAIAGIARILATTEKTLVIISTPQNTLSKQWKEEVEKLGVKFDVSEVIDGSTPKWKSKLSEVLLENRTGFKNHCVIYTTHMTASSDSFLSIMERDLDSSIVTLFVGDEVHWLGAPKLRKALLPRYNFRIGLSATPTRWFDDEGSQFLIDYFGKKNFVFSIRDALNETNPITGKHFLVNYFYHIYKVGLNEEETFQYKKLTQQMLRLQGKAESDPDAAVRYERLVEQRANIIKNANEKYDLLTQILDEIESHGPISNLLVFVSPQQISEVSAILASRGIIFHRLTEQEGTKKEKKYNGLSEREFIISKFKSGDYQALIAIKCLDEGIDIPSANTGILMASSTNPREYVQRIGRIIRQGKGKTFAHLYDLCVGAINGLDNDEQALENKIKNKEIIRLTEIAENAINAADATQMIISLKN
jgi:superfamily II DNA or RNA helicase